MNSLQLREAEHHRKSVRVGCVRVKVGGCQDNLVCLSRIADVQPGQVGRRDVYRLVKKDLQLARILVQRRILKGRLSAVFRNINGKIVSRACRVSVNIPDGRAGNIQYRTALLGIAAQQGSLKHQRQGSRVVGSAIKYGGAQGCPIAFAGAFYVNS